MKEPEFILEVYEPGTANNVWGEFSSSAPFMPINVGDILNTATWQNSRAPTKVLRVINLEHMLWETETHIKHKISVYTEEVEGTRELRLERSWHP